MVQAAGALEDRLKTHVETLASTLAHADRKEPFSAYCRGLILPGERKSVEPMAARIRPEQVSAAHRPLHHLVAKAAWSDQALLATVREQVLPVLGPVTAWIVDGTGFPKKGKRSVGAARQYCGELGQQDNGQVAVSLSLANEQASLPIACRLYPPEGWAKDTERRGKAGVPREVVFQAKPQIALGQIRVAGILPNTSVWPPGTAPLPPKPWSGRGRPPTRLRREAGHVPIAAEDLARALPAAAWQLVRWRGGTTGTLASRFAALRVRPGHRDHDRSQPWPELWLLAEWPEGEDEPTKPWLAKLPADTPLERLVALAKLRWRIARDYQQLKQAGRRHRPGAWVTSKGGAGAAFTTTPACASRLTAFSSWNGRGFPLAGSPVVDLRRLAYPRAFGRAAPGLRRQRQVPHSVASLRHRLAVLRARQLDLCPCCGRAKCKPQSTSS